MFPFMVYNCHPLWLKYRPEGMRWYAVDAEFISATEVHFHVYDMDYNSLSGGYRRSPKPIHVVKTSLKKIHSMKYLEMRAKQLAQEKFEALENARIAETIRQFQLDILKENNL